LERLGEALLSIFETSDFIRELRKARLVGGWPFPWEKVGMRPHGLWSPSLPPAGGEI